MLCPVLRSYVRALYADPGAFGLTFAALVSVSLRSSSSTSPVLVP